MCLRCRWGKLNQIIEEVLKKKQFELLNILHPDRSDESDEMESLRGKLTQAYALGLAGIRWLAMEESLEVFQRLILCISIFTVHECFG